MERKNKLLKIIILFWIGLLIFNEALWVEAASKGQIQAEKVKYFKDQEYFLFQGNSKIEYKDYVIKADLIKYYQKEDRAVLRGNVVVYQGETRLTGQEMIVDLKKEEFIIDGDVYIYYVRASKKKDNKDKENDVIEIRAGHVEFQSGEKDHFIATKKVIMEVEDRTIKSEFLEYKGDEKLVIARENVEVIGKDEEKLNCDEFTLVLEGEDEGFEAVGQVQLEFTIDNEKEDESAESNEEN
ncbi:hypothetical protein BBF96_11525 [Anoxybacter fermentans]|uniref:Organic solvent tolerance-like N-terminal domain-containing protein n=1 Tax=Anoxybacter fermentans TaxID=1323375 RepID=A0A3S9T0C6_9FIRM|nr:LptA/OstA family protein [Anoxybacter fermentans]AZR73965.1 hypothetical protein BBF96_11525 [Anoxybacter fermentans]